MCGKFGVWCLAMEMGRRRQKKTQKKHHDQRFQRFPLSASTPKRRGITTRPQERATHIGRPSKLRQPSVARESITRVHMCHKENTPYSLARLLAGLSSRRQLTHTRTQHCCAGRPCRGGVGKGRRAGQRATPCVTLWSQNL